jgi:hypothetical protein
LKGLGCFKDFAHQQAGMLFGECRQVKVQKL